MMARPGPAHANVLIPGEHLSFPVQFRDWHVNQVQCKNFRQAHFNQHETEYVVWFYQVAVERLKVVQWRSFLQQEIRQK